MSKNRSICRRCHRLRALDASRHCVECLETLKALGRPRRADVMSAPEKEEPPITERSNATPTLPPPATPGDPCGIGDLDR